MLKLTALGRQFDGRPVLKDIDLSFASGEVVGLVGENGAGKSTLLNVLSGVIPPTTGEISLGGRTIALPDHRAANAHGIFRVFQDVAFIPELTVEENLLLGAERRFTRLGLLRTKPRRRAAESMLASAGLEVSLASARVSSLSLGTQQHLSIVKAFALAARHEDTPPVLLLDEPTTALDRPRQRLLMQRIRETVGAGGIVILTSHLLPEVLAITDRVVVLRDGVVAADAPTHELSESRIHTLMVGRERADDYYSSRSRIAVAGSSRDELALRDVRVDAAGPSISLTVTGGSILALAGLEGSGKELIGEVLVGLRSPARGSVLLNDRPIRLRSLRAAIDRGIAYIPQDRMRDGLIASDDAEANIGLASIRDLYAARPIGVRRGVLRRAAADITSSLSVVSPAPTSPVQTLSGGNQQKVLLAKWLIREPQFLIVNGLTQGVDTGARESIYRTIRAAADRGAGVVIIGDDISELIGLADHIAVFRHGAITSLLDNATPVDEVTVIEGMFTS